MSNEERNEMTSNIDIDLASIPHPKDCHPVPDGAVLPAGTPCWVVHKSGAASWLPGGYQSTSAIYDRGATHLTPHPIIPHPTPEDSPIIITRASKDGVEDGSLAVWVPAGKEWCVTTEHEYSHWLDSDEITEWSPAIVTKSGRGIWDERDKRDRVNADGYIWRWYDKESVWACVAYSLGNFGSLNAIREFYSDDYLVGFADGGDAPCEQ